MKIGMTCALAWLMMASWSRAQTTAETAPQTTEDALYAMVQQAAVVFAGQVAAVRRLDGVDGATGVVEIQFSVEDAVRGVSGNSYVLREWAGPWTAGSQSLHVGERYLVLLHAPGAAGLSSPVGGMDGAIPIRGGGQSSTSVAEPPPALPRMVGTAAAADARIVDLRWVATRVVRPGSSAPDAAPHPTALPVRVRANAIARGTAREPESASYLLDANAPNAIAPGVSPPLTQDADYATVLGLLHGWEKASHAAR